MNVRIGGLFLNYQNRDADKKLCTLCPQMPETIEHFALHCAENTHVAPDRILAMVNPMEWMMTVDRGPEERIWINTFLHKRWDTRCEILDEVHDGGVYDFYVDEVLDDEVAEMIN